MANLPDNILVGSKEALLDMLPKKSTERYMNCYDAFKKWLDINGISFSVDETVLLAYFNELSKKYAPPTLWSVYSMLKSTIIANNNINISTCSRLISYLKKKSVGYQCKKSKVFNANEIQTFLLEAPDIDYLAMKVILVFGVAGGCRGEELTFITTDQVKDCGEELIVSIPDTKTRVPKIFPVNGEFAKIVQKYMQLRPKNLKTDRFFLQYRGGSCKTQVIGRNMVSSVPKKIAEFLHLDDHTLYTGHSFRRTSATILADSGAGLETIKRHGLWKSSKVAEGYVQESLGHKRKIGAMISDVVDLPSSINNVSKRSQRIATCTVTSNDISTQILASHSNEENVTVVSQRAHFSHLQMSQHEEKVLPKVTVTLPENTVTLSSSELNRFHFQLY